MRLMLKMLPSVVLMLKCTRQQKGMKQHLTLVDT
jgi:hypothetical protein